MEKKAMDVGEVSSMTKEKVILLEKAGFIWAKRKGQAAWEDKFRELQEYWQKHGHCKSWTLLSRQWSDVRSRFGSDGTRLNVTDCTLTYLFVCSTGNVPTKNQNNRALGRWVSTQRSNYKKFQRGRGGSLRPKTDDEEMQHRINRLNGIGFIWNLLPGNSSNDEQGDIEEGEESNEEEESEQLNPHDPLLLPVKKGEDANGNDPKPDQGNDGDGDHGEEL
jgi:hypothetical protein